MAITVVPSLICSLTIGTTAPRTPMQYKYHDYDDNACICMLVSRQSIGVSDYGRKLYPSGEKTSQCVRCAVIFSEHEFFTTEALAICQWQTMLQITGVFWFQIWNGQLCRPRAQYPFRYMIFIYGRCCYFSPSLLLRELYLPKRTLKYRPDADPLATLLDQVKIATFISPVLAKIRQE